MICLGIKDAFIVFSPSRLHLKVKSKPAFEPRFRSRSRICCRGRFAIGKIVVIDPIPMAKGEEIMLTSGASGRVNALLSMQVLKSLLMLVNAFFLLLFFPFRGRKRCVLPSSSEVKQESGGCGGGGVGGGGGVNGNNNNNNNRKGGLPVVRVPSTIVPWKSSSAAEVAGRRALAIRKVTDGGDGSRREFSLFVTPRGDTMFTQSWTPISTKTRAVVVLLHGLNEHCGRYDEFAKELNAHGYKVYGMDWVGHGGSDGLHAYVHSLDDAVSDVKAFIRNLLAENTGLPCFCFGHSTGGAIILKAVLDPKVEKSIAGVVLTSPAVGVQPSHPIFVILAPVVAFLMPKLQISAANKKGMPVSRDPAALVAKYSDPLVYTGSIRVKTGYEILRITSYLQRNMSKLNVPFYVLHGTDDTVTDPDASRKLYEEAASDDKSIRLLPGYLHDLLFEPEREEIMRDIIQWLNDRM